MTKTLSDSEIQAIIDANAPSQGEPWDMSTMLRAAYAKGYEAGAAVPREPTQAMINKAIAAWFGESTKSAPYDKEFSGRMRAAIKALYGAARDGK